MLTDEEIQELIQQNTRAWDVWLNGYQAGIIQGANDQLLSNEQAAEDAARRLYALQLDEERHRTFARNAVKAIDIEQNRRRPDSTYIPRKAA
ncbi:hypothetical protein [Arthrobacter globiformis]|uniref:hypothetical protein n=1 Tax=Arthrobacter globiformis TaxID=1665 RepID=UPI001555EE1D|nr:hypothetical protein [Arthrobacter globiformis]